jgi:hypothetical protein
VVNRWLVIDWSAQGLFIQIVLQDRFYAAVADSADGKGPFAGALQTVVAVAFGKPQDAKAASKGLLRIGPTAKNAFDQRPGIGADLGRPVDKALRAPLEPFAMGLGHMLFYRGVMAGHMAADMAGHSFVFIYPMGSHQAKVSYGVAPS